MKIKIPFHAGRRHFLAKTVSGTAFAIAAPQLIHPFQIMKGRKSSKIAGIQIGVITYSYRSMPDQSLEGILQYVIDSGINAVELMGDPAEEFIGIPGAPFDRGTIREARRMEAGGDLTDQQQKEMQEMKFALKAHAEEVAAWRAVQPMDRYAGIRKMFEDAGVKIFAFKPRALAKENTDAEIAYACQAAHTLGASHLTVEIPQDDTQTARLGRIASKHNVFVAYHGHLQQTPTIWDAALEQSPHNAMNPDLGHYIAAGQEDVIGLLEAKHDRIKSVHLKDRMNPAHGKQNMPWGQGDTPLVDILQHMKARQYSFPATIELEYPIPEGSDAVTEVKRCLNYCKEALLNP